MYNLNQRQVEISSKAYSNEWVPLNEIIREFTLKDHYNQFKQNRQDKKDDKFAQKLGESIGGMFGKQPGFFKKHILRRKSPGQKIGGFIAKTANQLHRQGVIG